MKKSCGIWLAVYVCLAAAVSYIVYRRFPETGAAIGAGVVGGGILWLAIGYFWGIGQKVRAARTMRNALAGAPPVDGQKFAAMGRIEPASGALSAPFSRTPCVAYQYEIRRGWGDDETIYCSGFALTPSVIRTKAGSIRLLAWADIEKAVTALEVPAETAKANAQEYLATTPFPPQPAMLNIRQSLKELMAIYRDDDGSVKWDQKTIKFDTLDFDAVTYREWLIRPGEQVCVVGTYSQMRGGIVPSDEALMDPVTLGVGAPEVFASRAAAGGTGYFIGGLIFTAIAAIALTAFFAFVPIEASEQMSPSLQFSWPELRVEQFVEKRVRPKMREMGMLNAGEFVSITLPAGEARGRVRIGDTETNVSRAVARTTSDGLTIAINEGAVELDLDASHRPKKLSIGGRDVPIEEASIQVLDRTEGRVTYVAKDRACHVTYQATEENGS